MSTDLSLPEPTIYVEPDGRVLAAYVNIRWGVVAETREIVSGSLFVDLDSEGRLLGMEILGPPELLVLVANQK